MMLFLLYKKLEGLGQKVRLASLQGVLLVGSKGKGLWEVIRKNKDCFWLESAGLLCITILAATYSQVLERQILYHAAGLILVPCSILLRITFMTR